MSAEIDYIKLDVQGKIALIRENLLKQDPLLPTHLRAIHQSLTQYEELVHLLSEDEIEAIIAGQQKQTGVELTKAVTTKSKASVASKLRRSTSSNSAVDEL